MTSTYSITSFIDPRKLMNQTQPERPRRWAASEAEFNARIAEYNRENAKGNGHIQAATPEKKPERINLIPFDEIKLGTEPRYLVKGIIPRTGLTVAWGPPKCGKSFWIFDLSMHVALGQHYRDRRVQ